MFLFTTFQSAFRTQPEQGVRVVFQGLFITTLLLFSVWGSAQKAEAKLIKKQRNLSSKADLQKLQGRWLLSLKEEGELQGAMELLVHQKSVQLFNLLNKDADEPSLQFSVQCKDRNRLCLDVQTAQGTFQVYVIFRDADHAHVFLQGEHNSLWDAVRIVKAPKGAHGRFRFGIPYEEDAPSEAQEIEFYPKTGEMAWVQRNLNADEKAIVKEQRARILFLAGTTRTSWEAMVSLRDGQNFILEPMRFIEIGKGLRLLQRPGSAEMAMMHRGPPPQWLSNERMPDSGPDLLNRNCAVNAKKIKKALHLAYDAQLKYFAKYNQYADDVAALKIKAPLGYRFEVLQNKGTQLALRLIATKVPIKGDAWELNSSGNVRHILVICSN